MAANEYDISAGIVPIDNSTGASQNSFYIAAGLPPTDSGGGETPLTMTVGESIVDEWVTLG